MDSHSIIEQIGSALAPPENDRIAGKNQSLYAEPLDRVFNPYRKAWMKEWFGRQAGEHAGGQVHASGEYAAVLRDTARRYPRIIDITADNPRRVKAELHPLADRSRPNSVGYAQWGPVCHVAVDATPSGAGTVTLAFEGGVWNMTPDPDAFRRLLERICTLPLGCEKAIIRRHYREFLPKDLAPLYRTVTITEDMGRSHHLGGEFTYGHEAVLRIDPEHEMHVGYVTEYLWRRENYGMIMGTARLCLDHFRKLAESLPGLSVVTDHADDCGTRLTATLSSGEGALMDSLRRWTGRRRVTEADVKEVLDCYGLHCRLSNAEIAAECIKGASWREIAAKEVSTNLRVKENGWVLLEDWDAMKLYVSGERSWGRELYVVIPYGCPNDVYMGILREKDTLASLYRDLLSRHDYFTSAGLFPAKQG